MIYGICCVRDSVGIAAISVAYHLSGGLDRIIVIDDGSSDGTYEALLKIAQKSGKIDLFRFERKDFRHADMVNWAALRASLHGAKWIVNFDIDEFLWPLRSVDRLASTPNATLTVPIVNFIQSRFVKRDFLGSLLGVGYRIESDKQADQSSVERGIHSFLEAPYPTKVVTPASPDLDFSWGNHSVKSPAWPTVESSEFQLLHVPLRSRSALVSRARLEARQRAVRASDKESWQSAHFRRQVVSGNTRAEWKKNSARFGKLSIGGRRARLVADNRIRRCALRAYRYLLKHGLLQSKGSAAAKPLLKVGGLATMPSRASSLEKCIDSIVSQVDLLYVYLDKYLEVPAVFKRYNNVISLLPAEAARLLGETKDWGCTGKFIGTLLAGDCLYFGFDDDIIYPADYSKRLGDALAKFKYRALVGIHGAAFSAPPKSYTNDRHYVHFASPLEHDQVVDEIGTGTLAFRTGAFMPDFLRWPSLTMSDLTVAIDAHRMGLPRVLVRRPQAYLQAVAELQEDSLWAAQRRDETAHNDLMQRNSYLWEQRLEFEVS